MFKSFANDARLMAPWREMDGVGGGRGGKGGKGGKGGRAGVELAKLIEGIGYGDGPAQEYYHIEEPWKDSGYLLELLSSLKPIPESQAIDINQVKLKQQLQKPTRAILSCFTYQLNFENRDPIVVNGDAETAFRALSKYKKPTGVSNAQMIGAQAYLKEIIREEIEDMLAKQNNEAREQRIDEIDAEVVSYDDKFESFCGFRVESHPKTYRLMQLMTLAGWHVVMHFKLGFKRTRPSFLGPKLVPVIDVPTHPSYPSGHATQSYLVALALKKVFVNRDRFPGEELKDYSDGLLDVARRIGTNREWAGVHYESDSAAGRSLATQLSQVWFDNRKSYPKIYELIKGARDEWYENM